MAAPGLSRAHETHTLCCVLASLAPSLSIVRPALTNFSSSCFLQTRLPRCPPCAPYGTSFCSSCLDTCTRLLPTYHLDHRVSLEVSCCFPCARVSSARLAAPAPGSCLRACLRARLPRPRLPLARLWPAMRPSPDCCCAVCAPRASSSIHAGLSLVLSTYVRPLTAPLGGARTMLPITLQEVPLALLA